MAWGPLQQPGPGITRLFFLCLASPSTFFEVQPCLTASEILTQSPPPRMSGASTLHPGLCPDPVKLFKGWLP